MRLSRFACLGFFALTCCSSPAQTTDGGSDASNDASIDATDAAMDADAPIDAAPPVCPCTDAQFCRAEMCHDAIFANVCIDENVTVILDGVMTDDSAGHALGDALKSCGGTVRYVSGQMIPGVLDSNARPITGPGDIVVMAGGPFYQAPAKYMEGSLSPIFTRDAANG